MAEDDYRDQPMSEGPRSGAPDREPADRNDVSDTTSDGPGARTPGIFDVDPPPEIDPNRFGPIPIVSMSESESESESPVVSDPENDLPHWTEPATGQVPTVVGADRDWNDLGGPRWHGEGPEWGGDDLGAVLGDPAASRSEPRKVVIDDEQLPVELVQPSAGDPQRRPAPRSRSARRTPDEVQPSGERNIPQAIGVGVGVAVLALIAFRLSGNVAALALITLVAMLAAIEVFNAMRHAGSHPATLLGIVACAAFPVAVYHRGDAAFAMVIGLTVVFGALWYLSGADTQRPALNLGLTFMGVSWIGVLAGFAGLILRLEDGKSIMVVAIIITAIYDTGALAGGTVFGKPGHQFHPASPSKTWEGTITGFVLAVATGAVLGLYEISPFSERIEHALYLGLVVGILAPIGDLTESLVKRDLGVKDMGTLLPGHGGVLDRIDGLLFVLPGVYYLALLLGYS